MYEASMTNSPAMIMVRPQMGENIGAAARVMKNFGLSDLRIVSPRDGWPNEKALAMSAHASDVVQAARLYDSLQDAVADLQWVAATTARERAMEKPVKTPREFYAALPCDVKAGIVFGPERTGLENDDLAQCHLVVSMAVNPEYPSLNLAQAVAIMAYEAMATQSGFALSAEASLASTQEVQGFFGQLEAALDEAHFWRVEEKKPAMWRNIRTIFQRAQLTVQEVRTLRGVVTALKK